jgi:bifunctional DNA-binding transcriptional regulator/antitoxin component of YhaV-PrlF toxin-antitoxin module
MSSKGQITLPIVFRCCYGIRPGTKIVIEVKDDAVIFTPYRSKEGGAA